ncbi:hypothetical protein EDC04DRAFT_2607752 [Pisolithus marmoratus]|nr:hypothetical protein EDC04DRAFT_2607752 [Pisolithus marmoratus]
MLDLTVACETTYIMLHCSTSTSINPYYPMNITWKTRSGESKDGHGATNIDQQQEPIKMRGDHSTAMSQEQWLFRQSSPIVRDGVTHVIISHIPTVVAVQRDMTPLILQRFAPPVPSVSHVDTSSRHSGGETLVPQVQDSTSSSGEASQPSAGHAPLITNDTYMVLKNRNLWQVSPWKLNKFRDTTGSFHWFRSEGNDPLSFPPSHIEDVAEGDLFFYWVKSAGKCQMWIWRSVGGMTTWVPVREGEQILGGDGNMRYLVITDGRQPSLVQAVTWERRIHPAIVKPQIVVCCRPYSILLQHPVCKIERRETIWNIVRKDHHELPTVLSTRIIPSTLMYVWDFHEGHKGPCFGMARLTRCMTRWKKNQGAHGIDRDKKLVSCCRRTELNSNNCRSVTELPLQFDLVQFAATLPLGSKFSLSLYLSFGIVIRKVRILLDITIEVTKQNGLNYIALYKQKVVNITPPRTVFTPF